VLVTGSRDWRGKAVVWEALSDVAAHSSDPLDEMVVVHGNCPTGADAIADLWAVDHDLDPERHPANWLLHGRAAGLRRNTQMVRAGADICLAFSGPCRKDTCPVLRLHGSHGTQDAIDKARRAGIPVTIFKEGW